MRPRAIFRADASPSLGAGHVARCLALADALSATGWASCFWSSAGTPDAVPGLRASGHPVLHANTNPAAEQGHFEIAVIDHYDADAAFEAACRRFADGVLAIDDAPARQHDCDILLDQAAGRAPDAYDPWAPADCRTLLGPEYALIRPEFAAAREGALARRHGTVSRMLVTMGGADERNATMTALAGIRAAGLAATPVDIVVGPSAGNLDRVRTFAETHFADATVHAGTSRMADLMAAADLCVGAGGVSTWERCAVGLPTLMFVLAANQVDNGRALHEAAAAVALNAIEALPDAETVAAALRTLADDGNALRAMSAQAAGLCDGRGASRVAAVVNRRHRAEPVAAAAR